MYLKKFYLLFFYNYNKFNKKTSSPSKPNNVFIFSDDHAICMYVWETFKRPCTHTIDRIADEGAL